MKIYNAQAHIKTLLEADALVTQYGEVGMENGVTDYEPVILQALQEKGAYLLIGDTSTAELDTATFAGQAAVTASVQVFIYDTPATVHTPAALELIDLVIAICIQSRIVKFNTFDRAAHEFGGVVTVITFGVLCEISL